MNPFSRLVVVADAHMALGHDLCATIVAGAGDQFSVSLHVGATGHGPRATGHGVTATGSHGHGVRSPVYRVTGRPDPVPLRTRMVGGVGGGS